MHFPSSDPLVSVACGLSDKPSGPGLESPHLNCPVCSIPSTSDPAVSPLLPLLRHPKGCVWPITFPFLKKNPQNQTSERKPTKKTTVEASRGNCFNFLNYLMEQKCFMRLFREREGQMSLIKADLLTERAGKWKGERIQLPVSVHSDPGLGSRLGWEGWIPNIRLGWWVCQQVPHPGNTWPALARQRCSTQLSQLLQQFGNFMAF